MVEPPQSASVKTAAIVKPSHAARGGPPEALLDVKGLSCPLPVLRANRLLRGMQPGERLRVLATDRASVQDFHAFCRETGHALVAFGEEQGTFSFVLRRRADDPAPEPPASAAAGSP